MKSVISTVICVFEVNSGDVQYAGDIHMLALWKTYDGDECDFFG